MAFTDPHVLPCSILQRTRHQSSTACKPLVPQSRRLLLLTAVISSGLLRRHARQGTESAEDVWLTEATLGFPVCLSLSLLIAVFAQGLPYLRYAFRNEREVAPVPLLLVALLLALRDGCVPRQGSCNDETRHPRFFMVTFYFTTGNMFSMQRTTHVPQRKRSLHVRRSTRHVQRQ